MEFRPISEAPTGTKAHDQILCRFYNHQFGYWMYFVAYPAGPTTWAPGYAKPEEWAFLPED